MYRLESESSAPYQFEAQTNRIKEWYNNVAVNLERAEKLENEGHLDKLILTVENAESKKKLIQGKVVEQISEMNKNNPRDSPYRRLNAILDSHR